MKNPGGCSVNFGGATTTKKNIKHPMKYKSRLVTGACIVAVALCGTLSAADKNSPSPAPKTSPAKTEAAAPAKKPRAIPFRGKASAIDQSAKTFTIAGKTTSRTFKVTDTTTVTKAGSPATFADLTENEDVTGSYWKMEDGTLEAKSLKVGGKTEAEKAAASSKKKKSKKAGEEKEAATPDQ